MNANSTLHRFRSRLRDERGFTMIVAMGVMLVSSLLLAATFVALQGDTHLNQSDIDGKRAYYAARDGLNAYLYNLNQSSSYWQTCSNDTQSLSTVPGSTTGEQYEYYPVPANGASACNTSNIINTMIDTNSGSMSLKFYGHSGSGTNAAITRGIIATFRRKSPLDYLWYTVYEALDSSVSGYSDCAVYYRSGRNSHCNINWITGDVVRGSMYTQDQFLVPSGNAPVFGRSSSDTISTLAPDSVCAGGSCPSSAVFKGVPQTGVDVPEPTDNTGLLTAAQNYGKVYSGITTVVFNGTTATVTNCPSTCGTPQVVDLTQYPIIYVQNATGCSPYSYSPFSVTYYTTGCTGDVYVSGNYTASATIAAANNIIVAGSLTTTNTSGTPTGNAVLGLVANQFVRIKHDIPTRPNPGTSGSCPAIGDLTDLNNVTVDAAVLALQHSFIVDNYDCDFPISSSTPALGTLTLNGSIVQRFRGPVGTTGGGSGWTGYLKNYSYDDRLGYLAPPYLFDILTASWKVTRETTCTPGSTGAQAC